MKKENPFADYGTIVSGSRFIGRKNELIRLRQRVLPREGEGGNFAIMGLPRIGKSSLMWQGVMARKPELLERNTIPVWYTASKVCDTFFFLRGVCKEIIDNARQIANEQLSNYLSDLKKQIDEAENKEKVKEKIEELIKELTYQKIKVILLIDEFDAVQSYMTGDDFGFLRTISYEPNRKICIVTTSRKAIKDIEAINGAVSNFYGTFDTLRLGLYDEDSLDDYWNWVAEGQPPFCLNSDYKQNAVYMVGAHPFLLDFYNYHHWLQTEEKGMGTGEKDFQIQLKDIFDTMQGTLSKEKLLDAAIQLVVGPVMDIAPNSDNILEAYNFIVRTDVNEKAKLLGNYYGVRYNEGYAYSCFSPYLTTLFAYQHLFDIPYWPEWQNTEVRVRGAIKKYVESLGTDWEQKLLNRFSNNKNWMDNYKALKTLRSRTLKRFPNASPNIIDYTLPANMFSMFIGPAWGEFFANVFLGTGGNRSGNRDEWRRKFQFLAEVRNPQAHSNGLFVDKEEINQAKLFCREITQTINFWEQNYHTL